MEKSEPSEVVPDNVITEAEQIRNDEPVVVDKPKESKPIVKLEKPAKRLKTKEGKLILGEEEWVYIKGLNHSVKARIDTGATTSSASAIDIVTFERDGKDWVKFKLAHNEKNSEEIALPVSRWVKIKQSSNTDKVQERPIVLAWIQLGDVKVETEFTLTDRSHLNYGLLMGRSFFRDIAVVDVSKSFVQPKVEKK
ncbi:ATP-dependent zinc protease [Aliivibrio kagoshimensis]